jgi:excisionase family DNA binding protein
MRRELDSIREAAQTLEREQLPRFLGDLEEIRAVALARLSAPVAPAPPDEWLTIEEAAKYIRVEKDFLYERSKRLGKKAGGRLLFSRKTLDAFVKNSQ